MSGDPGRAAARFGGLLLAAWAVALVSVAGLGLLVTGVLDGTVVTGTEDGVVRAVEGARTPLLDDVTSGLSRLGDTWTVVACCALAVLALWRWLHRWAEPVFVAAVTVGQSAVFLAVTTIIDRERPEVRKLDEAPPTSSFPSGHTGASLALALALSLVVHRTVRRAALRRTLIVLLLAVPVLVAVARIYRGMHHPTDLVGSALNAVLVVLLTDRAVRAELQGDGAQPSRPRRSFSSARKRSSSAPSSSAVGSSEASSASGSARPPAAT